jgi:glyoxylase-like metal-dependent hydrolase (beta-lactamase superfamily II)
MPVINLKTLWLLVFILCSSLHTIAQEINYRIYAVRFARSGYPFTEADWAYGASKTKRLDISFSVWLIKGKGRTILVDAGFQRDIDDAKDFQLSEYIRPDSALQKLGITADQVTDVVITHPHWDHIDGIDLFPKAHFWIQKEDYNNFVGGAWQEPKDIGGFAKRDVRKLLELNLAGRLSLVNGDNKEIIPGITVYTGSKHTFNSQYVLVKNGKQHTVIASDNIWIYANLQNLIPPVKGGTLDPAGYVAAMRRMKTMASDLKFIIPGHDGDVYKRFPSVSHGIVEIK